MSKENFAEINPRLGTPVPNGKDGVNGPSAPVPVAKG